MKPIENSCGKNISTSNHRSYREELLWGGCRNGRIPKSSKLLSVLKNRESDCFGLAKSQETPIRTIRLHFFNDFFCLNSQFQLIMIMFNSKIAIFGRSTFSDLATFRCLDRCQTFHRCSVQGLVRAVLHPSARQHPQYH